VATSMATPGCPRGVTGLTSMVRYTRYGAPHRGSLTQEPQPRAPLQTTCMLRGLPRATHPRSGWEAPDCDRGAPRRGLTWSSAIYFYIMLYKDILKNTREYILERDVFINIKKYYLIIY
jgi:hypothetical protein